jgi:hypothetical protein
MASHKKIARASIGLPRMSIVAAVSVVIHDEMSAFPAKIECPYHLLSLTVTYCHLLSLTVTCVIL